MYGNFIKQDRFYLTNNKSKHFRNSIKVHKLFIIICFRNRKFRQFNFMLQQQPPCYNLLSADSDS